MRKRILLWIERWLARAYDDVDEVALEQLRRAGR